MTSRGHAFLNAGVLAAVALNILLTVYHYGRLTQTVQDLSQRVTRLEQTIDYWRGEGSPVPLHPQTFIRPQKVS